MKIEDSVVLVTGASSGIGKSIALAVDRLGAKVAMAARRRQRLLEIAKTMDNPLVLTIDMSDEKQAASMVRKTIRHFGRIDVLINNAATIIVSQSDILSAEDLMRAFKANLIGPVIATNEAVRQMRKQGNGHIINIGSPGFMIGIPLYGPYVCSKAAMSAWTRSIQAEWAGSGISVSEYFPGYIKTDSPAESAFGPVEQDAVINKQQNFIAAYFTRPKSPEDVARHVMRLIERPRPLKYSSMSGRIGSWLSNISRIRIAIASGMADNVRRRLGLSVFGGK